MVKRLRKFLSFEESHVIKKNEKKILRKFAKKKKLRKISTSQKT